MTQCKRIAIDTSKAVFTLHGVDQRERPVLRINLRRARMIPLLAKLPATEIAMEACGGAHHWAREPIALGHAVRLIAPQYVKPYVKRGKNDRNDAAAIREAAGRPGMRFVPVKSVTQQARGMVLKVRESLVGQRIQLANTLRGQAAEFGVIVGKGPSKIAASLAAIEQAGTIPSGAKDMAVLLGQRIAGLDARIKAIKVKMAAARKANAVSQRLATIPGVGPITALTLAIEIDPAALEAGRHRAAWAGLTPQEQSTGGKRRIGGISRAGNERVRVLPVTGAMSVIKAAMKPGSQQMTEWLRAMPQRKPRKLVAVALANKMPSAGLPPAVAGGTLTSFARIAGAAMTRGEVHRRSGATIGAAAA